VKSPRISKAEFKQRVRAIQDALRDEKLDGLAVYGDEYRKENLRYVSNFWPIFERSVCFIPARGEPVLGVAAEGERYAREMTVWDDVRVLKEFAAVTVPTEIDYPLTTFSSLQDVLARTLKRGRRLGMVGLWDMSERLLDRFRAAAPGVELVDADHILVDMRLIKSPAELACLKEAGRLACVGYEELMAVCEPGRTELEIAGAGEGAAKSAGAEAIIFMVLGSGPRTGTVIGRPVRRVIEDGDMVMASLAVQYEGYVATAEFPFVAGQASAEQQDLLGVLFEAANVQLEHLHGGAVSGEMVRAVRDVFRKHHVDQYDVYPPMHGIGLAEAESPYPDETSTYPLRPGMCVNSDISLFGHPAGSNRIEEGFLITEAGPESITPFIRALCEQATR